VIEPGIMLARCPRRANQPALRLPRLPCPARLFDYPVADNSKTAGNVKTLSFGGEGRVNVAKVTEVEGPVFFVAFGCFCGKTSVY